MPFTFITTDVAEATCACLVAQTEEAERTRQIEVIQERMILQEFGRCLMQVIESANRTKLENGVFLKLYVSLETKLDMCPHDVFPCRE